jgi:hypothetical protein
MQTTQNAERLAGHRGLTAAVSLEIALEESKRRDSSVILKAFAMLTSGCDVNVRVEVRYLK